jgi:DNA gyrase subunit B
MTDADVDGSHIRTLLLTFLFRHMRQLVDGGYVFVAQPPLYQISRKRHREYLRNDAALNRRLTEWGLSEAKLVIRAGRDSAEQTLEAERLRGLMEILERIERQARVMQRRGIVFEEFVRRHRDPGTGALPTIRVVLDEEEHLFYNEAEFAEFLRAAEERYGELELTEPGKADGHPPAAQEAPEGTKRLVRFDLGECRLLVEQFGALKQFGLEVEDYFAQRERLVTGELQPAKFVLFGADGVQKELTNLAEVVSAIREFGSRGAQVKRYKGLGEMNAEELWETTMDPARRALLKVTVSDVNDQDDPEQFEMDAREADRIFSILMGDDVDSRREFIETNALNVRNLDV